MISTFLDAADADNLGGPPGLIFGPDCFAAVAPVTAAAAGADDGLPTTTAFSQHSFIYNAHTAHTSVVNNNKQAFQKRTMNNKSSQRRPW